MRCFFVNESTLNTLSDFRHFFQLPNKALKVKCQNKILTMKSFYFRLCTCSCLSKWWR